MRRVRWAQGLAFAVIALALLATAGQSYLGVQRAAESLIVGQGQRLLEAVQRAHATYGPGIEEEAEHVVEQNSDFGLRCIGIFRRDYVFRAGNCLLSEKEMQGLVAARAFGEPIHVGDRIALVDGPRPPPGGELPGALPGERPDVPRGRPPRDRPPRGRPGPERGVGPPPVPGRLRPPPPVVIEFEPLEAMSLQDSAAQGAVVALLAVGVLLVGSLALWRLSSRAERIQERAERDRRLATLGEMASVLAHEIRNPLAGLKGHAQLLAEKLPEGTGERRSADRVVTSAVRLEKLTHDLLSFVRSPNIRRTDVAPATLVREAAAQVAPEGFEIEVSQAPERWRLDPERMQQVLVNLLRNAVEASPPGKPAQVSVRVREGALVFGVRDFGDGIARGTEEKIFEPFYTGRVQGTGLGLAVARRIVELHGGTVTARNREGGGAEFEVVIP